MRTVLVLILFCFAWPAQAGLRATYADGADPEKHLIIEASDQGDARVSATGQTDYGLLVGNQFYMVGDDDGHLRVARIEDIATAIDQVVPPIFKNLFGTAGAALKPPKLRIVPKGDQTIAGLTGRAYAIYGLDDSKPDSPTMFVISSDPKLQPIGEAMAGFINAAVLPMAALIGPAAADMVRDTRAIFALGAPLDAGGKFRLEKLETVDPKPDLFALPAKPATVNEIVAEMKARSAK
jgi:hypothetical protein